MSFSLESNCCRTFSFWSSSHAILLDYVSNVFWYLTYRSSCQFETPSSSWLRISRVFIFDIIYSNTSFSIEVLRARRDAFETISLACSEKPSEFDVFFFFFDFDFQLSFKLRSLAYLISSISNSSSSYSHSSSYSKAGYGWMKLRVFLSSSLVLQLIKRYLSLSRPSDDVFFLPVCALFILANCCSCRLSLFSASSCSFYSYISINFLCSSLLAFLKAASKSLYFALSLNSISL